jgi:hypothetical protein
VEFPGGGRPRVATSPVDVTRVGAKRSTHRGSGRSRRWHMPNELPVLRDPRQQSGPQHGPFPDVAAFQTAPASWHCVRDNHEAHPALGPNKRWRSGRGRACPCRTVGPLGCETGTASSLSPPPEVAGRRVDAAFLQGRRPTLPSSARETGERPRRMCPLRSPIRTSLVLALQFFVVRERLLATIDERVRHTETEDRSALAKYARKQRLVR